MKKSFGDRLRDLRGDYSQSDIAEKIGVSGQSWGFYERDQKEPTLATVGSICKMFNISADWLLGLSEGTPRPVMANAIAEEPTIYGAPRNDVAYWRDLAVSQQATIAKLTTLLSEGRANTPVAPVQTGGRSASKTA